jgi:hypothetical protein
MFRERRTDSIDAAKQAALSGALTGGTLGSVGALLGGARSKAALLKAALLGAGAGGTVAGGTNLLGTAIMGPPAADDPTAYTRRGAVGGAVGGGLLGAGIGALAAKGKIKIPGSPMIAGFFEKMAGSPTAAKRGAILGALGLGAAAAYQGSDEGMQVDAINQEMERRRRQALLEEYGG